MPGSPGHLGLRFFDVLRARPLEVSERAAVTDWLSAPVAELFFAQSPADQRHGYHAALIVVAAGNREGDTIVAALVHDIAKRHAGLGVIGRSAASLAIMAGLPLSERWTAYRDHGIVGAGELAAAGAPALAIDFALHHHGARPSSIPAETWDLLVLADQPPKATVRRNGWITSDDR